MINSPLNKPVQPKEHTSQFELLPKGDYQAKVASIGDWKGKNNPTLKVFEFDSNFRKVQDSNGKDKFTIEQNVQTFSAQVIFEIISGKYAGQRVYYYLNLHPNQPWALASFLNACGIVEETIPLEVQAVCTNAIVEIGVDIETTTKDKTDPVTGATVSEPIDRNVVKKIKALELF